VGALRAALRGLDVDLGPSAPQHKAFGRCWNTDTICSSSEHLAVLTVANAEGIRIDDCLICDISAMTASVTFVASIPLDYSLPVGPGVSALA
jgi:hypothetical protein